STRSVLRSAALTHMEPGAVLEAVNDQLQPEMPPKMFVTCVYGVLEPATGRFVFANAGHNLPCVQTADGAVEARATGMPLGLLPGMRYEENEVTVDPGRAVLLYSDALPEAHDASGEMFGFPRLVDVVGNSGSDGQRLIDRLLTELHGFTGADWEQEDDITLVAVQRTPSAGEHVNDVQPADDEGRELVAFTVASEPGNERIVMERIADAVVSIGVDNGKLDRLKTAVAEASMNAIEHGNHNRSELLVEVRVFTTADALVVRITDQGGAQAIPETTDPDLEAKLRGEESPRGWGLFLIRNMVDEVNIFEDTAHHTVELIMRLDEGN
ncbi:MAG: SpoIIE family protein phosphatase, partial [Actinomycetota bacterium]|nr:SpoIIE family protein phosphatase [Actinomycetota bacterium]